MPCRPCFSPPPPHLPPTRTQTLLFSLDCRLAELPDSDEDGGGKAVTLRTEYKEAYGEPDGEHTFVIADTSPGAEGAFAATFTKLVTYV